jgi:hypothetical protein
MMPGSEPRRPKRFQISLSTAIVIVGVVLIVSAILAGCCRRANVAPIQHQTEVKAESFPPFKLGMTLDEVQRILPGSVKANPTALDYFDPPTEEQLREDYRWLIRLSDKNLELWFNVYKKLVAIKPIVDRPNDGR